MAGWNAKYPPALEAGSMQPRAAALELGMESAAGVPTPSTHCATAENGRPATAPRGVEAALSDAS